MQEGGGAENHQSLPASHVESERQRKKGRVRDRDWERDGDVKSDYEVLCGCCVRHCVLMEPVVAVVRNIARMAKEESHFESISTSILTVLTVLLRFCLLCS